MEIVEGGLEIQAVVELLSHHLESARAETAIGSAHALDLDGLRAPGVSFWSIWSGDVLAGVGALKDLGPNHGEVKSMHTAAAMRGHGVGGSMLDHIVSSARKRRYARLSLETGSWPYFEPAWALYRSRGFVECPPFGDYRSDPNSVFMTKVLG